MYSSQNNQLPIRERPIEKENTRQHRSKLDITFDLLSAIQREEASNGSNHWKTRVQANVFLSWNSFKEHLSNLEKQGLIKKDGFGLTEEGKQFLQVYRKELRPFLDRYELSAKTMIGR